jgi:hypothetical protein
MAVAGDLGKLPPELRKEIYSYLLVEEKRIVISRYKEHEQYRPVRMGSYRNPDHSDSTYDRYTKEWTKTAPSPDALLLVNKLVSQEAAQVLYGLNHFEFEHVAALQSFLECVGDSRQHLRRIALLGQGLIYAHKWEAMDTSLRLMTQASGLRSLELPHLAFCGTPFGRSATDPRTFVQHCKPLLESLKASFERQNLDISILDVIRIELDPCHLEDEYGRQHHRHHRPVPGDTWMPKLRQTLIDTHNNSKKHPIFTKVVLCNCNCRSAEKNNLKLMEDLLEEIWDQLDLSDDEKDENEEVE